MTTMQTIGKYEIIQELGRGGFAVVYQARDTALDRPVALKVLHPHWSSDPGAASRFLREARLSARLHHLHIVTVYEAGEANGRYYLAMAYLPGRTLRDLLASAGALPLERALPILTQIASALDYAHAQGLIHRDVKPANIIIEETGAEVQATLTDFGLVRALAEGSSLTSLGAVIGSPEYMAPEHADPNRATEVSPATDCYALGIVAYEILTGRVPFPGNTPSTLYAHEHKPPPAPRSLRPDLLETCETILLKMLAKAPADRYPNAGAFVAALQQADQAKTHPRPPQPVPAAGPKWVWGMAAGLLILACLVGLSLRELRIPLFRTSSDIEGFLPPTPIPTLAPLVPALTPKPTLGIGSTHTRKTDGMTMIYVPAGSFTMGSNNGESDEKPPHQVTLDAFWLDQTEVTNAQYNHCVEAGKCQTSPYANDFQWNGANFPVVGVTWQDAVSYCLWTGGRLPTEAEWEYAACGPQGFIYPWGNELPSDQCLNYNNTVGNMVTVSSYPAGASWVGAQDLAGNVWEWVNDWYADNYYANSLTENPVGPVTGTFKVLRGGSWFNNEDKIRAANRDNSVPGGRGNDIGFRCAVYPGDTNDE